MAQSHKPAARRNRDAEQSQPDPGSPPVRPGCHVSAVPSAEVPQGRTDLTDLCAAKRPRLADGEVDVVTKALLWIACREPM